MDHFLEPDDLSNVFTVNSTLVHINADHERDQDPPAKTDMTDIVGSLESYQRTIEVVAKMIGSTLIKADGPIDTELIIYSATEAVMRATSGTVDDIAYNGVGILIESQATAALSIEASTPAESVVSTAATFEQTTSDRSDKRAKELIAIIQKEVAKEEAEPSDRLRAARGELIGIYDRFLKTAVNRAHKKRQSPTVDFEDLYQEGAIHIIRSAERFKLEGNPVRFISYFADSLIKGMRRREEVMGYKGARISEEVMYALGRIDALNNTRRARKSPLLTSDEIAELLGWDASLKPNSGAKRTVGDFWRAWLIRQSGSLDTGFANREDGDISAGNGYRIDDIAPLESLTLPAQTTVEDEVMQQLVNEQLEELLQLLDARERTILRLRFGFGEGGRQSFREIGEHLNLSPDTARRIGKRAINKLRNVAIAENLWDAYF